MDESQHFESRKKWLRPALLLAVVMILVISCSIGAPAATSTPLPTSTNTTVPTDTALPTETPQPTATKKPTANYGATQQAQQQGTSAAATEFAGAVLGEVQSKLDEVGVMMGSGSVIFWNSNPIPVEILESECGDPPRFGSEHSSCGFRLSFQYHLGSKTKNRNCLLHYDVPNFWGFKYGSLVYDADGQNFRPRACLF